MGAERRGFGSIWAADDSTARNRGVDPLAKLWRQLAIGTNWPVLVAVAILSALGVLSIWADEPNDARKQLLFLVIGLGMMAAFQMVDYRVIGRWAWAFYVASIAAVAYTIVGAVAEQHHHPLPGVHNIKGAYNWISFGSFSLQPAELVKISFVMVMARYLRFRSNYRTITGLVPPLLLAAVPLALILKQPDLGTALIFIPALFVMLFVAGAKLRHLGAIIGIGLVLAPFAWFSGQENVPLLRYFPSLVKPYQRDRVYAMFNNDPKTLKETGFQQYHALIAFGSGGVSGKGVGNIPVGDRVPEAHNDMIFALIGEQFGFFGAVVVLTAYIVLFAAGVEIAASNREPFGRLVALGIVAMLAGQTFLNLFVCLKLMPVTGVTLPFVSYGGSSLLASFMAAGLLLNIGQNRPLVIARDAFEFE